MVGLNTDTDQPGLRNSTSMVVDMHQRGELNEEIDDDGPP